MLHRVLICFVLLGLVGSSLADSFANPLKVTDLPGYQGDAPNLTMWTGYVTVDESHNRNLFYWHVQSLNNPMTDPLVFWYNGGPGCSGLGGFFTENGPFTVNYNKQLAYNTLHWANIANVVWLEQPAGVGFSYSDDPADYNTNDTRAAQDNYAFLQGFLQLFPQYSTADIWLVGESYAGIYIPTLSSQILNGDDDSLRGQLTGLMLGNPLNICPGFDYNSIQYNIFYWHGLVSPANYLNWTTNGCDADSSSQTCNEIFNIAQNQIGSIVQELSPLSSNEPSLDPDDLYQDFCTGNGTLEFSVDNTSACYPVGQRVQDYLNLASVQTALSVVPTTWVDCTNNINYTVNLNQLNMNPYIQEAFKNDVEVLIYSGDVDVATVPFWFTTPCVNGLGSNVMEDWQPWFVNEATAGYVTVYEDFTFATLKGAGHEAPEYQPLNAYQMFSRFLMGDADLQSDLEKTKAKSGKKLAAARMFQKLSTQGMKARSIMNQLKPQKLNN